MQIEIKCRFIGSLLYSGEHDSVKLAVEAAVAAKINLGSADLRYADLRYADLRYVDLGSADLGGADLGSADLGSADLRSADLRGADLGYADLGYADLGSADLRGADLTGVRGRICDSHELLAHIAIRFDASLTGVAAMIAGRLIGCWGQYTQVIRAVFGESVMRRLRQAWSQDESWGVVEKMREYEWPEPVQTMPKEHENV